MLKDFLDELYGSLYERANDSDLGGLRKTAFIELMLGRLEEADIIPPARVAFADIELPNLRGQVHGYAYDSDEGALMMFYCIEANEDEPLGNSLDVRTVNKEEVDKGFRRLESFVRAVKQKKTGSIDLADPAFELVQLLEEALEKDQLVYLYVLCSGTVSERTMAVAKSDGFQREIWDLLQFARNCTGTGDDRLSINFEKEFGTLLPGLSTEAGDDGVQVFLTCIPGDILADVYATYRARLLERNVRSFLQFSGKVNKGIRETVLGNPAFFLPFNNGLSATASSVDLENLGNGLARIRAVHDFQIVNGGQTTATLSACKSRDKADLSKVSVAMKLTVVPIEQVDTLVPQISRFANMQNKMQEADFDSNNPWHVEMERFSRTVWTAPTSDSPRGTRWYYERSRGQQANELAAINSAPGKVRFKKENPNKQKISKTDIAKYILSWEQEPSVVNRGAQVAFGELMKKIRQEKRDPPDMALFTRYIALAMLFRTGEDLYGRLGFFGYRASFVAYAVALLSYNQDKRLPFQEIWDKQVVRDSLSDDLEAQLVLVNEYLLPKQLQVARFSTYLKSAQCWTDVLSLAEKTDVPADYTEYSWKLGAKSKKEKSSDLVARVVSISPDVWFAMSGWAFALGVLETSERQLAFNVSKRVKNGQQPTRSEAERACKALQEAVRLGFSHPDLSAKAVQSLGWS